MAVQPLIGITCNVAPPSATGLYRGQPLDFGDRSLAECVARAGGLPLLLPVCARPGQPWPDAARVVLAQLAGLVLAGGADLGPLPAASSSGLAPPPPARLRSPAALAAERDLYERALALEALQMDLPLLGVCRGLQLLAVVTGGALHSDLEGEPPGSGALHRDLDRYVEHRHAVRVAPGSTLASLTGAAPELSVSSAHHQGVRDPGPALRPVAWAPDGLLEAAEIPAAGFVLAVQWHPEWLGDEGPAGQALFDGLVSEAAAWRGAGSRPGRGLVPGARDV